MYEFHTVQSNRNYSEKPQDSNNKNIRINGFVTVSPQVFIIENRIKATGPSVSCNTPFCRGETWRQGLAWAGSGWTVTKFSVPSSSSQEAQAGPLVALACSQKMLKLKLQGQNQQVTIFCTQSPLQPAQWLCQLNLLPHQTVSPGGCKSSHTETGTLANTHCCHPVFPRRI